MSSSPSPPPLITRLPPELIDHLLTHVPPQLLQRTALSLLQVFPDYPLSYKHLWRYLIVSRAEQMWPLWRKLKAEKAKDNEGMLKAVRAFAMQSWKGDADILNNVMRLLPELDVLLLNIGTNFAPDHLEEMFTNPRTSIKRMEMRFRPYVEQAMYYQFLAGSYFDTSIETMYRKWPEIPSFTHLSIVQDLPPRVPITVPPTAVNSAVQSVVTSTAASAASSLANSIADLNLDTASTSDDEHASGRSTPPTSIDSEPPVETKGYTGHGPFPYISDKLGYSKPKTFAQPIVFFDIKCIARFGASPVAANITHLRLRVPSRDLAFVLIGPQASGRTNNLFPSLRYLDISTTNVRLDSVLSTLLRSYNRLEHLVLDRVNLFGFKAKDKGAELCKDLGGVCVSAGLARGKERERLIAAWEVMERTRWAQAEAERRRQQQQLEQARGDGSEGSGDDSEDDEALAAVRAAEAAEEERQRAIAAARSRRGHRSAAHSTISLRDRPLRNRASASTSTAGPSIPLPPPEKAYFVLPPLPTLRTVSIGGEAHQLSSARVQEWDNDFHAGWRDGLGKVQGWATHVAEKYERAMRKAEEWYAAELKDSSGQGQGQKRTKGKSAATASGVNRIKPPTDIKLFRFPLPNEPRLPSHAADPTAGLIQLEPVGRDYLTPYKLAIADAELYAASHANPAPCILCTVPDCEGPVRRGAEGERVDGRGGLGGKHKPGCGHLLGRTTWGWNGDDL